MKSWVLEEQAPVERRPLAQKELSRPVPQPERVLVRVRVCGLCRTDLHVVEGDLPLQTKPITPGHQVVGEVVEVGEAVREIEPGARVGVAWLHKTCGACSHCLCGEENLCERAEFTGWSAQGGYAEYLTAPASFVHPLPEGFSDLQAAPLLCAGIIGYRALRATGLGQGSWSGRRLGIYGFGAAGHVAIQVARARGAEVFVMTRDREKHQALAGELGAAWVGGTYDRPPVTLNASIIFAPAGEIVPAALEVLRRGGTLVLGGIHMSAVPPLDYRLLYYERRIVSVMNNTRDDARAFLAEAARIPVQTHVEPFPFEKANEALIALKNDAIRGAGVLLVR